MSTESTLDEAEKTARAWKQAATEKAAEIRDYAKDKASLAKDRLSGLHSDTEDLVRENPNTSILVALGVGIVIGLLLRK